MISDQGRLEGGPPDGHVVAWGFACSKKPDGVFISSYDPFQFYFKQKRVLTLSEDLCERIALSIRV